MNLMQCDLADEDKPVVVDRWISDDIFTKQMFLPKAGTIVKQHSHEYEHMTMLPVGRVLVRVDGVVVGEHEAPTGIRIAAGVKHEFETLEDWTVLYCIHNISRSEGGAVEIRDEHRLVEA